MSNTSLALELPGLAQATGYQNDDNENIRMNWDAIAAIGSIVSAFAVLITLVYLAIQVKQSNRNDENHSRQTILSGFFEKAYAIAENNEIRALMRTAYVDFNNLSDDEKTRFDLFQMWFWGNLHSALILRSKGLFRKYIQRHDSSQNS